MRQIRVFDIFCGAGGSSCGAAQAGGRIVGGLDLWNHACATFQSNFPKAETFNTRLSARSPLKSMASKIGQVDLQRTFGTDASIEKIHRMMSDNLDIKSIRTIFGPTIETDYPYTLDSADWKQIQMEALGNG